MGSGHYGHLASVTAIVVSGLLVAFLLVTRPPFRQWPDLSQLYEPTTPPVSVSVTVALSLILLTEPNLQARVPDSPVNRETLERLLKAWETQRAEIVTAELEVTVYRYVDQSSAGLAREPFLNTLSAQHVRQGSLPLETLSNLLPDKNALRYFQAVPMTILLSRNSMRNESEHEISLFDGKNEVRYRKGIGGQVSVFSGRSGVEILGLKDVRYVPLFGTSDVPAPVLTRVPGSPLQLHWERMHVQVDERTAFIESVSFKGPEGKIIRDILHYDVIPHSGGILFPGVTIDATYVDDRVKMLSIYEVVVRRLNTEIPADRFVLGAPRATTHVDYRADRSSPVVASLPHSTDNVLQVSLSKEDIVPFRWHWFLATSVGFVMVLIGIAFYFRRIRNHKESHT